MFERELGRELTIDEFSYLLQRVVSMVQTDRRFSV